MTAMRSHGGFTKSWAGGITKQLSLTQVKQELILPTKNLTIKQTTRHQKSLGFASWKPPTRSEMLRY